MKINLLFMKSKKMIVNSHHDPLLWRPFYQKAILESSLPKPKSRMAFLNKGLENKGR